MNHTRTLLVILSLLTLISVAGYLDLYRRTRPYLARQRVERKLPRYIKSRDFSVFYHQDFEEEMQVFNDLKDFRGDHIVIMENEDDPARIWVEIKEIMN